MTLFTPYEQRPPTCQAIRIWYDTINDIADYYSQGSYQTTIHRDPSGIQLHITHQTTEHHPGCDLTIELPFASQYANTNHRQQMLIYGNPPTLEDAQDFDAQWREAKTL